MVSGVWDYGEVKKLASPVIRVSHASYAKWTKCIVVRSRGVNEKEVNKPGFGD